MAAENCTEVSLEEGHQSPSERQVESPKTGLTNPIIDPAEPPKKDGHQSSSERQVEIPKVGLRETGST